MEHVEALAFAKDWIERNIVLFKPKGPDFQTEAILFRLFTKAAKEANPCYVGKPVAETRANYRELDRSVEGKPSRFIYTGVDAKYWADEAVHSYYHFIQACRIAASMIENGQSLPKPLKPLVVAILRQERHAPQKLSGKEGAKLRYVVRNEIIIDLILALTNRGILATKNDEPSSRNGTTRSEHSACDIVAQACRELGVDPRGYRQVKAIWLEGKPEK